MKPFAVTWITLSFVCSLLLGNESYYTWVDDRAYVTGNDAVNSSATNSYKAQIKVQKWIIKNGTPERSGQPSDVLAEPASTYGGIRWVGVHNNEDTLKPQSGRNSAVVITRFEPAGTSGRPKPYTAEVHPRDMDNQKQQKYTAPGNGADGKPLVKDNHATKELKVVVR